MKQSLQLRLGQSLTMTPQLQQAIRLLQLSTMELNMEVQRVLEDNVMLDMVEDEEEFIGGASGDQAVAPADINLSEQNLEPRSSEETLALDIPEELPVDGTLEDIYDTPLSFSGSDELNGAGLENQRGAEVAQLLFFLVARSQKHGSGSLAHRRLHGGLPPDQRSGLRRCGQ